MNLPKRIASVLLKKKYLQNCVADKYDDLLITTADGEPFISTFGIYIDRIADMGYRKQLLKVLIPMQMELDGTAEIYESEEPTNEMEM